MNQESKISIGIIGAGIACDFHIPAILENRDKFVINSIASQNFDSAKTTAERYSIKNMHKTVDELLNQHDLDMVLVTVPVYKASQIAMKVIESGKGLILDKPMASNTAEAELLMNLANKQNNFGSVAENFRYKPEVYKLKELIKNSDIGKISSIDVITERKVKLPNETSWRTRSDYCGWSLEAGIHYVAAVRALFGEIISVNGSCETTDNRIGKYNNLELSGSTNDNVNFRIRLLRHLEDDLPNIYQIKIVGDQGTIEFRDRQITVEQSLKKTKQEYKLSAGDGYEEYYANVYKEYINDPSSISGLTEGYLDLSCFQIAFPEIYTKEI